MLLQRAVLPLGGLPFVILLLAAGTGVRAALPTTVVTNVVAEETKSSGAPVLVRITVTNVGQAPFTYWCGGPATYPGAHHFVAHVTDEPGRTREAHLSNGQYQMGSGTERQVLPGQSVTLPAALEPLSAGTYTIQVGNCKLVRVIINDDEQLAVKREQNVLKRARQGEPFAQHVAARFPADSVTRALLQDLASKEEQVSLRAATTLGQFEKLPADSGPLVERAMQIHLTAELKKRIRQTNLLIQLAILAGNLGSDQAMSAVLALAVSTLDSQTRGRAINQLGRFKQEQAAKALRGFLRDMNDDVRFEAARTLANRKDPAAVDELLAVAADKQNRWRAYAYLSLANFPSDARAKEAIEKGLDDPEDFARSQAQQALRELRRNQKK